MSLKYQVIRAFAWNLSDKIINQLGYLAITIYIARLIGPESFGLIGMMTIFILLADSVVSGGFTSALVQRSQGLTEDDSSTVFWINLGWGIFIYFCLYMAAPWIAEFYRQHELIDIARVLFLVVIINTFTVVPRAKLIIAVDFKSQAIANAIATLMSGALALLLVKLGYGYWALVWLMLSKALISSFFIWWFCRWLPRIFFSKNSFNSLFGFGSNLMIAGFVATIVNNLYIALIARFFNATQVGFYTQATNLSNYLTQFISSSLQGVTYPIMTSIKDDRERLVSIYKELISITMLVSLPLLVGFAAISKDVVLLFLGEEWLPTVPVLVALCMARTITPVSAINMNILNAVGRSDLFLKVDLLKLPLTIGALFIALPYGVVGLAWATMVTSFIAFFINAWFPGSIFKFGARAQLRLATRYIIASVFMFIALGLIQFNTSYFGVLIKICVGIVIYFLLLVVMKDLWVRRLWQAVTQKS